MSPGALGIERVGEDSHQTPAEMRSGGRKGKVLKSPFYSTVQHLALAEEEPID